MDAKISAVAAQLINRRAAKIERVAHQHAHSADADQKRRGQADSEPLRAQENNFAQRHENGNRGEHHGGDARRHALLGPEQQAVIEQENYHPEDGCRAPFTSGRCAFAAREYPAEQNQARNRKAHGGQH